MFKSPSVLILVKVRVSINILLKEPLAELSDFFTMLYDCSDSSS